MSFYKSLLVFFFCLFAIASQAQQKATISGKVLDVNGSPIPFADVSAEKINPGSMSDADGNFTLVNVPAGSHRITANSMGYKSQSKTVLVKDTATITINFSLKEDFDELEEVVVKGKSQTQSLEESGLAVNSIETKDVQNQSIQANELLDQSAGVRVRQSGGLGSRVQYNLNGMSGNSIRIFLDGIPMDIYGYSFSLNSIPTALIERIEVYKGVVPAELGSDALGGAINVVTKKNAPNSLNTSYSFGSFNSHQWSLNGNYRDNKSGFTVRGSTFYNFTNNNYKVWGDQVYVTDRLGKVRYVEAERFNDDYQSLGTKLDFGFTGKKWADQFFVGLLYSDMKKGVQHGATMESVYGNRRFAQNTLMFNTSYIKNDFLIKNLDINAFTSYSDLTRRTIDTIPHIYNWFGERADYNEDGQWDTWASGAEGGDPTLEEAREKHMTGRVRLLYTINDRNSIGINYLYSHFQRDVDDPLKPMAERELIDTRYLSKTFTGLTYRNTAFKGRLKTSLFLKHFSQTVNLKDAVRQFRGPLELYEYNAKTNETGYGVAVAFFLTPALQLTSSAENAIRLPTNQEIFGNSAENIDPSYELRPERSQNLNLGFNLQPHFPKRHNFRLSTNFFYRNTTGMIRQAIASAQAETFAFENLDEVLSQGVDGELRYSYRGNLALTTGFSVFNARFNRQFDEYNAQYIYYKDRLRNEPYFTFNNNIRYSFRNLFKGNSKTSIYYNTGYVHQFYRNWESLGSRGKNVIPAQLVHSIGVAYTFPKDHITLSLDARNITNEQVFDNWALQKPGRAFFVKFNYSLK